MKAKPEDISKEQEFKKNNCENLLKSQREFLEITNSTNGNLKSKLDTTVEINSNPEDKSRDIIQNYILNKKHGIGNMIEQLRDMENRLISKPSCWFDLPGVSFLNSLSTLYSSKAGPFSGNQPTQLSLYLSSFNKISQFLLFFYNHFRHKKVTNEV